MATKSIVKDLVTKIQTQLQANSSATTKAFIQGYMKNVENYRGLKNTDLKAKVFKDIWAEDLKSLDREVQKEIAHQLLRQGFGEDKYFGTLIFDKIKTSIDLTDIQKVEKLFKDGKIVGWANTDGICSTIFKPWASGKEDKAKYICGWKDSDCLWLQRASCVTFVSPAKLGDKDPNFKGFLDLLLETCGTTIKNQERFVQLGTGWLLRNIGTANKSKLLKFIEENIEHFTSEGLSYAVEKLDAATKKKMRDLRSKKNIEELEEELAEIEEQEEVLVKKRRKKNAGK